MVFEDRLYRRVVGHCERQGLEVKEFVADAVKLQLDAMSAAHSVVHPQAVPAWKRLAGKLPSSTVRAINMAVDDEFNRVELDEWDE